MPNKRLTLTLTFDWWIWHSVSMIFHTDCSSMRDDSHLNLIMLFSAFMLIMMGFSEANNFGRYNFIESDSQRLIISIIRQSYLLQPPLSYIYSIEHNYFLKKKTWLRTIVHGTFV